MGFVERYWFIADMRISLLTNNDSQPGPANANLNDDFLDDFFGFQGKFFLFGRVTREKCNAERREKGKKGAFEVLC